jgi:DNA-binding NtrC family response regulator
MSVFSEADVQFAATLSRIVYCNPFTPQRIDLERDALGGDFVEIDSAWNMRADSEGHHANLDRLTQRAQLIADSVRLLLAGGEAASVRELELYEDMVIFLLYHRYYDAGRQFILDCQASANAQPTYYQAFRQDVRHYLQIPGRPMPDGDSDERVFAFLFQVRRAFYHIFNQIVGSSRAISRLRSAVWQSIFTHDARRYRRSLYTAMGDMTTLVTGPSGTGKELVARAIGLARYIPFTAKTGAFAESFASSFHPLNLSALSATLIESELFGHCRGSFTGAVSDRAGWLESCGQYGTVFLDEIGELDGQIQVKLLRVLQTRTLSRLGETRVRHFRGKIIAATNRDLAKEMAAGAFREDLYYRLCSDLITTPSLREQLTESPDELLHLIRFIARQFAPGEAEPLAREVLDWVHRHLGDQYPWPGNFRELEQCVRNVLIRGEYRPLQREAARPREQLAAEFLAGAVSADELLRRYCTIVYAQTGSYQETAARIGLDRRTVKAKIDPALLATLRS